MAGPFDSAYYSERAARAIDAAKLETDEHIAEIHIKLAANYIELAELAERAEGKHRSPFRSDND